MVPFSPDPRPADFKDRIFRSDLKRVYILNNPNSPSLLALRWGMLCCLSISTCALHRHGSGMRKLMCKSRFFIVATSMTKQCLTLRCGARWVIKSDDFILPTDTRQGEVHLFSFLSLSAGRYFGGWNVFHTSSGKFRVFSNRKGCQDSWKPLSSSGKR